MTINLILSIYFFKVLEFWQYDRAKKDQKVEGT